MTRGETIWRDVLWYYIQQGTKCNRSFFEYPDGSGGCWLPCDHIKNPTSDEMVHYYFEDVPMDFGYGEYYDAKTFTWMTESFIID